MNWHDKKVLIMGYSLSGRAAAKYLAKHGADVYITEGKTDILQDEELDKLGIKTEFGKHTDEFIEGAYIAIVSPSVPVESELYKKVKGKNIQIISEIELAYKETGKPFIGITGTNGKTTVTALTSHIFSSEYNAPVCGNIGVPPTSLLDSDVDYFVCELSSFQMEHTNAFRAQVACWTNFTPDHITWHGDLEHYFDAKAKLFKNPTAAAFAVLNGADEKLLEFSNICAGDVFLFDKEVEDNCSYIKNDAIYYKRRGKEEFIIKLSDCPLIGHHNYQNIMCSVIMAKIVGISNEHIRERIMSFVVPEHRLEKVREYNGIVFYNDSKATNPEASIVAINSFNNSDTVLIAGGRDKLTTLEEFCSSVKNHIKTVILIGEATERFELELKNSGFMNILKADSMETAIDKAIELKPDNVLLSPACASFDMFSGYEERGTVFKNYVLSKK
ncbi:MAG: UDP-N-acetylmuramoyl-L-alanine--D-glutamate ligase [Candidatus Gastranaerophilaceae bacterium]